MLSSISAIDSSDRARIVDARCAGADERPEVSERWVCYERPMARGPKQLARGLVERILDLADERRRLDERTAPATKIAQRSLFLEYRRLAASGELLPSVWETGYRIFSQFDEDGVILFCLAVAETGTRRFVDIGSGDGLIASNTANLALNLGFHGLFVDAREPEIERGRRFYATHPDTRERPPLFVHGFVTRENVNDIVRGAGFEGEIDVLSIDIDGNDYWILEALECVQPRLVCIETHTELGLEDFVAPYDPKFDGHRAPPGTRIGASPVATTLLAERLGYRLVGANLYGFNTLYLRADLVPGGLLPTIAVEEVFRHASYGPESIRPAPGRP
jgi:hypothetical protein